MFEPLTPSNLRLLRQFTRISRCTVAAAAVWFASACSDSLGSQECSVELESGCWTHLGLDGHWVTSLADTPWGLFAGTGDAGVFRRIPDTGEWEALGLDHAVPWSMLFVPGPTPRLLVGKRNRREERTPAAVFATEDGGRTWLPWDGGLAERHDNRQWAFSLAMDPGDPERLYMGQSAAILRSTDGGRSWQYVSGDADMFGNGLNTIVISPERDGRVWAGAEGAIGNGLVLLSEDWGDTWDAVQITPGSENAVFALAMHEREPARLWAGVRLGVMRSEDYGRAWEYVLAGVGKTHGGLIPIVIADGDRLYALGDTLRAFASPVRDLVLYRSHDGGTTWTALAVPPDTPQPGGTGAAVLDSDGRLLIGIVSQPRGGVWRFDP